MRDISQVASRWWELTLREARAYYDRWKESTPLQRVQLQVALPDELQDPRYLRTEQRGIQMLLKAIPSVEQQALIVDRALSSTAIVYRLLIRFQPGGAGEKQILLKHLTSINKVDNVNDLAGAICTWRRHFSRASEVGAVLPDGVLLLHALDTPVQQVASMDTQAAFRLAQSRMMLALDEKPTHAALWLFSQCLLAEAETLVLVQSSDTMTSSTPLKMKPMDVAPKTPPRPTPGGDDSKPKGSPQIDKPCKFFLSDSGCKAGRSCKWSHSWDGVTDKASRCWICGGKDHKKTECTVRGGTGKGKQGEPAAGSGGGNGTGRGKPGNGGKTSASTSSSTNMTNGGKAGAASEKGPSINEITTAKATTGEPGAGAKSTEPEVTSSTATKAEKEDKAGELMKEATQLLKSLRINPTLKVMKIGNLRAESEESQWILLDSGATHALRTSQTVDEWNNAEPAKVMLAEGSTDQFRLKSGTKILLSDAGAPTSWIIPMGGLDDLNYELCWKDGSCLLRDHTGRPIEVTVRGGCPMVRKQDGERILKQLEELYVRQRDKLWKIRALTQTAIDSETPPLNAELALTFCLQEIFPGLPEDVLTRLVPPLDVLESDDFGSMLPWNRRKRRRVHRAKNVVVHVFAGENHQWWEKQCSSRDTEVLCVDIIGGPVKANLLDPNIYAYLLGIAGSGKLKVLLGGPPCRTVSALRYQDDDGPRPVRTEECPYGIEELTPQEAEMVEHDVILMHRFLALYVLAEQVRNPIEPPTQLVMEQPEDPARYRSAADIQKHGYMSVFRTEAWKQFQKRFGVFQVNFDQAPMGHPRRKPTTLATTMAQLLELDELRGSPRLQEGELRHQQKSLEARLEESKKWAAWAPGLKHVIALAVNQHLRSACGPPDLQLAEDEPSSLQSADQDRKQERPKMQTLSKGRLSLEQWRTHFLNDHMPARRDCAHCVRSQARSKPHKRIVHPEAYTLSLDLSGRLSPGDDQQVKGCKYILVGTYTYPVDRNGRSIPTIAGQAEESDAPLPDPDQVDEIPGEDGAEHGAENGPADDLQIPPPVEDPLEEQAEDHGDGLEDDAPCIKAAKSMYETWGKLVQEATDFSMRQLTFVEIVKSRHVKHILPAVSRIHARLCSLGLPLYRLHTDRAREFVSEQMRSWALERQVVSTMTPGSSFKTNGRVEGEMNTVKKSIRTLITAGVATLQQWPLVARHVGERRPRAQLHSLGWPVGKLIRFGAKAYALRKSWQGRYVQWRDVREEVRVLGPDIHSSLTSTGYFVKSIESGRCFHTDDVVIPAEHPPALEDQVLYLPERPPAPARRLRTKTTVPAVSMCNIEGEGMILRRFGQMFEPLPPRGPYKPPYFETDAHDDGSSDSWTLDATSDSDYQPDPNDVTGGIVEEGEVPNTWAGGSYPGTSSQDRQLARQRQIASLKLPALRKLHNNLTEYIKEEFTKIDGLNPDQAMWLPVLAQAVHQRVDLENHMLTLNAAQHDQMVESNNAEFVVTRTISNREVWENLTAWEESIRAEFDQLVVKKKAVSQITKAELQQLAQERNLPIELLPAKMVHTRKAPDGKYRSRAVICGNYAQENPETINYAGGADAVQCRALVRISASKGWQLSGTDIKVAFLNAPKRDATRITACEAPTVFKRLGLANEHSVWVVERALYGLPSSPRDWSIHRDQEIPLMKWTRRVGGVERHGRFAASGDENLWRLLEVEKESGREHWVGLMSVYVDDILIGAEGEARDAAMQSLAETWSISPIEHATAAAPLRFCGFEITKDENEDGFHISQSMYEKEILAKWDIKEKTPYPVFKISEEDEQPHDFTAAELRDAQAITGALLWLSTRSRPDLVYGLSAMSRLVSKNPAKSMSIGRALLAYINGNPGGLHYPREVPHGHWGARQHLKVARHQKLLEVYSDIAYAAGSNHRSIQGLVLFLGGCPIGWQTSQQPFITHSTAESELVAMCEGLQSGKATEAMLCAMFGEDLQNNSLERVMYGDNSAAIGLAHGSTASSWRTRHLRIRANVLREAVDEESCSSGGKWKLLHLNGKELVSDGCTKPLCGQAFFKFLEDLGMRRGHDTKEEPGGDRASTQHGGAQQAALQALMIGGVLMSSAKASGDKDDENDFTPVLVTGAILAAVGAVYVGKLVHDAASCCLKRLRKAEEGVGNRGRLEDEFSETESSKSTTRRAGKGGVVAAGPMSTSSTRSSGLSASSNNPLPRSGLEQPATSTSWQQSGLEQPTTLTSLQQSGLEQPTTLTSLQQSGLEQPTTLTSLQQSGLEQPATMTSLRRSGLEQPTTSMSIQSSGSGGESSTSLRAMRRSGTGAESSSSLNPMPQSGLSSGVPQDPILRSNESSSTLNSRRRSGMEARRPSVSALVGSGVEEQSLPRNAASSSVGPREAGVEYTDGGIAFHNPWSLFQHLRRGKGWSPQQMSAMYQKWKSKRRWQMPWAIQRWEHRWFFSLLAMCDAWER